MSVPFLITRMLIDIMVQPPDPYDDHGCCISCGYQYCKELNACVRVWETFCESLQNGH